MDLLNVPENTTIIREGDDATEFYVVDAGYLDVLEDGVKVCGGAVCFCARPFY
jgi:F0F1-type ATP synthase epsilon subunit